MKGVVHRAHTTETPGEDRAAGGHGSPVASSRAEVEGGEEKGGLHMNYSSQKPSGKAKEERWRIEGTQGSQVCFIFTEGERSMCLSWGKEPVEGNGISQCGEGRRLVSRARSG